MRTLTDCCAEPINEAESQREHNALDALLEAIAKNDEAEVRIRAGFFAKRCGHSNEVSDRALEATAFASAVLSEGMQ